MVRRMLSGILLGLIFVAAIAVSIPFVLSLQPSLEKKSKQYWLYNSPLEVDVAGMSIGELKVIKWQGVPIGIYRRSTQQINAVNLFKQHTVSDELVTELPGWWGEWAIETKANYIRAETRSSVPEFFVFNMVSPVTGCMVQLVSREKITKMKLPSNWQVGFIDPCSNVLFDGSDRVFKRQGVFTHLQIPPHQYVIIRDRMLLQPNG
ncbi:hypothetical protein HYO42_22600 [Vibrio parahaemolyticus]|nr:hypothetical protein [Vibrio parahaemolyticus]